MTSNTLFDIIIIGGASAGLTAALYASRQNLKTLVITKDIGGQALLTDHIENYPGFNAIGGFELMSKFEQQAKAFGAEFVYDEVTSITMNEDTCFTLTTPNATYGTCAVILAFGKTPRDLDVPGETKLKGKGVSYCAVCDGPLFRGKRVAVVGSGDSAMDAALLLSNVAGKVYLMHTWEKPLGDQETLQNLKTNSKIELVPFTHVTEIFGDKSVESIAVEDSRTKEHKQLPVDGVFVEVGYVAKTGFLKELVRLNGRKEIEVDRECATSQPGIFAAGDITDVPFKQAVISAGQGAIAALAAYNHIQRLRGGSSVRADWKVRKKA
jgi:thioredoxin reductase (NADPH)